MKGKHFVPRYLQMNFFISKLKAKLDFLVQQNLAALVTLSSWGQLSASLV